MHHWGDDWFKKNGDDLYRGIALIERTWRWGFACTALCKEKYGTFRDHSYWWDGGLHWLLYKSPYYVRNEFIYSKVDPWFKRLTKYTGLYWLGMRWARFIYNLGVQLAAKKYPNVVDELVSDLQYPEWVKPGLFGKIDGKAIHDKYWVSY